MVNKSNNRTRINVDVTSSSKFSAGNHKYKKVESDQGKLPDSKVSSIRKISLRMACAVPVAVGIAGWASSGSISTKNQSLKAPNKSDYLSVVNDPKETTGGSTINAAFSDRTSNEKTITRYPFSTVLDFDALRGLSKADLAGNLMSQIEKSKQGQIIIGPETHTEEHCIIARSFVAHVFPERNYLSKLREHDPITTDEYMSRVSKINYSDHLRNISEYTQVFFEGTESSQDAVERPWIRSMDHDLIKSLQALMALIDVKNHFKDAMIGVEKYCEKYVQERHGTRHPAIQEKAVAVCEFNTGIEVKNALMNPPPGQTLSGMNYVFITATNVLLDVLQGDNVIANIEKNPVSKQFLESAQSFWTTIKNLTFSNKSLEEKQTILLSTGLESIEKMEELQSVINAVLIFKYNDILADPFVEQTIPADDFMKIFDTDSSDQINYMADLLTDVRSVYMANRVADLRCERSPETTVMALMGKLHLDVFRDSLEKAMHERKDNCTVYNLLA